MKADNLFKSVPKAATVIYILYYLYTATNCQSAAAQQQKNLYYQMLQGTHEIGEMKVKDTYIAGYRSISTRLEASLRIAIFNIELQDSKSALFHNNILQSAYVSRRNLSNGIDERTTVLKENRYTNGKVMLKNVSSASAIQYSLTMIYTSEPGNRNSIYSEYHQQFIPIERIAAHQYIITTPDGFKGSYFYENGLCTRVIMKSKFQTITTILVSSDSIIK
jgi:hypothetical protein